MTQPTLEDARALSEWRPPLGVLSVYLGFDPADRTGAWRTELRNALDAILEEYKEVEHDRRVAPRASPPPATISSPNASTTPASGPSPSAAASSPSGSRGTASRRRSSSAPPETSRASRPASTPPPPSSRSAATLI